MQIITIIIIGLSISVDAFSLSLAYGLMNISKRTIILTSFLVGIFHFIMPLLGFNLGSIILKYLNIESKYVLLLILILILIEMIRSLKENQKEYELNIINIITFAFLVSIDSFTIGIGLNYITNNLYIASIIFSIMSFTFTLLGFLLGKYLSIKAQNYAKYFGVAILFTVIIYFLCKQ